MQARPPQSVSRRLAILVAAVGLALSTLASSRDPRLAEVQEHLDLGRPEEALELVERLVDKRKPSGEALLLRSTARIMLGDHDRGIADLRRAMKLDPSLRQGWLNLAAVEIAEERYKEAYRALLKAQELDTEAPDNHLNLGAVLVLHGELEPATEHFAHYLELHPGSAEAHYVVAGNYALGGYEALAIGHLAQAFELDEKMRLRARSDDKFVLLQSPRYHELLRADSYTPPAGAFRSTGAFRVIYDREDGRLLGAVLDSMRELGEPLEVRVEATQHWALVWGDFRVKVTSREGRGLVEVTAPAERFTPDDWERRTQALFRAVERHLEP